MSFAAGFAKGFVPSFQAGLARKEKRKDDAFKMKYNEFIRRGEKREKRISEDRKAVAKAKALTEGVSGLPEGAWIKAHEWVSAGLSDEEVTHRLKTGTFTASEMPAGQTSKSSGVDIANNEAGVQVLEGQMSQEDPGMFDPAVTQTQEALGQTPEAPAPQQAAQKPAGVKGALEKSFGNFGGIFKRTTSESINQEALERVADATGLSVEEVQSVYDDIPDPLAGAGEAPKYTPGLDEHPDVPDLDQAYFNLENARTPQELDIAKSQIDSIEAAFMFKEKFKADAKARAEGLGQDPRYMKYTDPEGKTRMAQVVPGEEPGTWRKWNAGPNDEPIRNPVPILESEADDLNKLYDMVDSKEAEDYRNQVNAFPSIVRQAGLLGQIAEETPAVVSAPFTSSLLSGVYRIGQEFGAARDVLKGMNVGDKAEQIRSKAGVVVTHEEAEKAKEYLNLLESSETERELKQLLGEQGYRIAINKAKADGLVMLMAYDLGTTKNQEGRAFTNEEHKNFMNAITAGRGGTERYYENISSIVNNARKDLETRGRMFNELNKRGEVFKTRHGWANPPMFTIVPTVDEVLAGESDLQQYLDRFSQYSPGVINTQEVPNRPAPAAPSAETPQGMPEGAVLEGVLPDGRRAFRAPDGNVYVE